MAGRVNLADLGDEVYPPVVEAHCRESTLATP